MISAYQSALSGLQTYGTRLQSNSNNIANSNTEGYKKSRVINESTEPQGVKAHVMKVETPGTSVFQERGEGAELVELSNVDLATEITDLSMSSHMYKANLKTIEVVEEMTGALINLKS